MMRAAHPLSRRSTFRLGDSDKRFTSLLVSLFLALAATPCLGKDPPNSVDLLATYCLTINNSIRDAIDYTDDFSPEAMGFVENLDARIQRLGAFMSVRLAQVDALSMLTAVNRAKVDLPLYKSYAQETVDRYRVCTREGRAVKDCEAESKERERRSDIAMRVKPCDAIDWLPF